MKSRVEEDRYRRGLTLSAVLHVVTAVVSSADFDALVMTLIVERG